MVPDRLLCLGVVDDECKAVIQLVFDRLSVRKVGIRAIGQLALLVVADEIGAILAGKGLRKAGCDPYSVPYPGIGFRHSVVDTR
jgi:hypothetical protein